MNISIHPSVVTRTLPTIGRGLLLAAIASAFSSVGAGATGNRGAFAALDPSARSTAWGAAAVVLTGGVESGRANPAGLLRLGNREASVSYADLFGLDLVNQTQVHLAVPFARTELVHEGPAISRRRLPPPARFAVGLTITQLRGEAGPIGPQSSTDTYRESEVGLTLAWRSIAGTSAGAHIRLLSVESDLETISASGRAVGIGIQRDLGSWQLGFFADNLVSSLDWEVGEDEPLPRRYHAGVSWSGFESRLRIGSGWTALGENGKGRTVGVAADWRPYDAFHLRGGLQNVTDVAGSELEPTAGLGFAWQGLTIDWGFRMNGQDLGTTHRWSASVAI